MSTLYDAFISYSRKDSKPFAIQLHDKFVEKDFDIWFDLNDMPPAIEFQKQINEAIENADNFIFIITPGSVTSEFCRKEIDLAVELNKRIIPLMYINTMKCEECKGKMHPMIKTLDQIFFGKKQLENGEFRFEDKFEDVLKALNRQWEYVEQHTRILVNAFKWQRHQKQTHYLLIGEERVQAETWLKYPFDQELPPCEPTDLHCEYICESTVNANNLMTQVFICYAIEDKAFMLKLQQKLMRHHITVWKGKADEQTRGDFQKKVEGYIEKADNFIYLISPNSLHSEIGTQQLDYAIALNKRVIALEIENAPGGEGRNFKYDGYFEFSQWDQLIRALHEDAAYYAQHKLLLVKALKWQWHGQKETMLLRGHNLEHFATWLQNAEDRDDHPPLKQQIEFVVESQKQPPVAALDVFISYSQADADLARRLNETLQQRDKTTWFDQETILTGVNFEQEIYQGIANADNFLFILSPKAVNSPYCAKEVAYAAKLNKRIITVLHRPIDETSLMPILKSVQWIDFNRYEGSFITNFADLLRTLNIDREYVRSHTEWMLEALKWSNHNRSRAYLLRDEVLMTAKAWLAQAQDKQPVPHSLVKELISESEKAQEALVEKMIAESEAARQAAKKARLFDWLVNGMIMTIIIAVGATVYIMKKPAYPLILQPELKVPSSDINDAEVWFNHGVILSLSRRYEEAIKSYDKALKIKQDYHEAWYNRGNVLYSLGRYEQAIASYDKALQYKPDFHEAWDGRGNALDDLGRYEDAIASYDKALQFKPDDHIAWAARGIALDDLGRYEDAIASYDKALQFKPDDHIAWAARGIALDDLGRYEDAIASYDKALQFKPDDHIAWAARGIALDDLGRYEDAIASYDKALQFKPDDHIAWAARGIALDDLGRYEDAIASYDKALQFKPDDHIAWAARGIALDDLGRYEDAIASYDKALQFKPDLHEAWYIRGIVLADLGRYEQAIASYDKALQFKQDLHKAWNNRGVALADLGRYEQAITSYDKALQFKLDYHEAWSGRGSALGNLGRYQDAIASFDKALQFKADYHEAWNNRGIALYSLGRYEDAIASYDKALQFKPDLHEAWYIRGIVLADLGRYEQAIASYDKALQFKLDKHQAWYNRGLALDDLGRYEDAIVSYDKALQYKPNEPLYLKWRDKALDKLNNSSK